MSGKTTVYYDGSCPLCTAEVAHYTARDGAGHLALVNVSRPEAKLPDGLTREAAMARFHVQAPDGALHSGAAGFATLWSAVPGWRWASRLARAPGVLPLLELSYRGFLRLRPALVRGFVQVQRLRGKEA